MRSFRSKRKYLFVHLFWKSSFLFLFIYNYLCNNLSLVDLRNGLSNLECKISEGSQGNVDIHRANLYSLINCVDALAAFHDCLQIERNTRSWPLTKNIREKVILFSIALFFHLFIL